MSKIKDALNKERGTASDMLMATWLQWLGFITFAAATILLINLSSTGESDTVILFGCSLITTFFFPYKPFQRWLKIKYDKLAKFTDDLFTAVFKIGAVLVIGGLFLWGGWKVLGKAADIITPDRWTLMVCDSKLNDYECYDNSDVIPGFKSKNECLLEGARNFSKQGYECGSNCKNDYGVFVCKEICNQGGCS